MHGFTNKGAMTDLRIHGLLAPEIIAFARGVAANVVATKVPHIALQKPKNTQSTSLTVGASSMPALVLPLSPSRNESVLRKQWFSNQNSSVQKAAEKGEGTI